MQSGLADIRAWVSYMGVGWCGEVADTETALEHSSQAVRYLLVGKDDCVRKATKVGFLDVGVLRLKDLEHGADIPGRRANLPDASMPVITSLQASAGDDAQSLTPADWIPAGLQMRSVHHIPNVKLPCRCVGL